MGGRESAKGTPEIRTGRFDLAALRPPSPPVPVDPAPSASDLPIPLAVIDREMRFRWANDALARALGFTVADLIGISWYTICPGALARRELHASWFQPNADAATLAAIELPPSNGGPQFARVRVYPMRSPGGTVDRVLVVAGDDTQRMNMQQQLDRELAESRGRLDVALAGAQVGVWRMNLAEPTRPIALDENCARLAGLPPEPMGITRDAWLGAVHVNDRPAVEAWMARAIAEPGAWHEVEYRHFVGGGKHRWILLRGVAIAAAPPHVQPAITGVVIDVGARKEAELAVRESEFRHRALTRMFYGFVYEGVVRPDGRFEIVWADEKFQEIWGCDVAEFNRRGWFSFVHPRDRAVARERAEAARNGQRYDIEIRVIDGQGRTRWLRTAVEPLLDAESGCVSRVIGMGEDITERKRLTDAIREAALREQERIGRDLHDGLGQVLTGISFLVQGMQTAVSRGHAPTHDELENIANLVRGAIETSRTLARGLSPLRLDGGLAASLADLARHAREVYGLEASCSCPAHLDLDPSTAEHLYRIAQEALTNAARHAQATRVQIELTDTPTSLRLAIEDDGRGVAATGPRSRGLGLRTMAHRAELIGGLLEVRGAQPNGTRIVCTIER